MAETDTLSLAELEAYGQVWGSGAERRALCPFCDHEKRDREHAALALNVETGAWTCHRCNRGGLLEERRTQHEGEGDPLRPKRHRRRAARPLPPPREPSPAELLEAADKRATLRRLWAPSLAIAEPFAARGADYLESRGIPLDAAQAAHVRYAFDWYGRPAVVFPVQDASGRLVGAEGRYVDGREDPKSRSAGAKSRGVFVATSGALDADGVTLCEGPITALSVAACGFPAIALCGHAGAPPWLVKRLALRTVFLSADYGEQGAAELAAKLSRQLAALGASCFRLSPPAGDWNDYLQAAGLPAMREALTAAICGALVPRP